MKTKLLFLKVISLGFIVTSCSSSRLDYQERTKTITKTTFTPQYISKEIQPNLTVNIEPIKADSINREIYNSLRFDGSYYSEMNQVYYAYMKNKELSYSERKLQESIENLFSQVDQLRDNKEIDFYQAILFKEKIFDFYIKKDIQQQFGETEPDFSPSRKNNIYGNINPYFSENRYNSIYKLVFENKENEIKDLRAEDFQIFSNGELLYPFKNSYFENKFKNEIDEGKLNTVYRMNMPDNIRIPNNQPIIKYFSTPTLNPENQNLVINYILNGKVIDFNFKVITTQEVTKIRLEPIYINYTSKNGSQNFNLINTEGVDYLIKKDVFLLEKNNDILKLLTLNVDFYNEKVKLTTTNFTTNNLTKNTIVVDNKK